jgi:hypothetical protein
LVPEKTLSEAESRITKKRKLFPLKITIIIGGEARWSELLAIFDSSMLKKRWLGIQWRFAGAMIGDCGKIW